MGEADAFLNLNKVYADMENLLESSLKKLTVKYILEK